MSKTKNYMASLLFFNLILLMTFQNCSKQRFLFSSIEKPTGHDLSVAVTLRKEKLISAQLFEISYRVAQQTVISDFPLVLKIWDENKGLWTEHLRAQWGDLLVDGINNSIQLKATVKVLGQHRIKVRGFTPAGFADLTLTLLPNNPILDFQPSLAVNRVVCLNCHAKIEGNLITTYGTSLDEGHPKVRQLGVNNGGEYFFKWNEWGGALPSATVYQNGVTFLPRTTFEDDPGLPLNTKSELAVILNQSMDETYAKAVSSTKSVSQIFDKQKVETFDFKNPTLAQYVHLTRNLKSKDYIDFLSKAYNSNYEQMSQVREVKSIKIMTSKATTPSTNVPELESAIIANIPTGQDFAYYPQGEYAWPLKNFGPIESVLKKGEYYFTNIDVNQPVQCDGDIFVNKVVLFNKLKVKTKLGCRIHSSRSIFISGRNLKADAKANQPEYESIQFIDKSLQSNIELMSSRLITLGLGDCADKTANIRERLLDGFNRGASKKLPDSVFSEDLSLLVAPAFDEKSQLWDIAADINNNPSNVQRKCYSDLNFDPNIYRSGTMERVLLAAPEIHSRFIGEVKGVIIADFTLGSLGNFAYRYDPVFNDVPVFPMIEPDTYFKVERCNKTQIRASADNLLFECEEK